MYQGRKWRVGRVGNCPPRFRWNRRRRRVAAACHHPPHFYLPTQCLVATYARADYSTDFDDSTDSVELPRVPCELCEQQYCRFTRVFSKLSPIPEEEFDQDQSTQTTNQPEKIANGETTLKEKPNAHDAENDVKVNQPEITNGKTTLEAKSNVSGDVELPTSDPNEIIKIEREERGSSKINKQSIYAKEDPEGGAEAGKQRVREVFHMDVAELIIERDA